MHKLVLAKPAMQEVLQKCVLPCANCAKQANMQPLLVLRHARTVAQGITLNQAQTPARAAPLESLPALVQHPVIPAGQESFMVVCVRQHAKSAHWDGTLWAPAL